MRQLLPVLFVAAALILSSVQARVYDGLLLFKVLPEYGDEADFGTSVAISGTTAIVGAPAILGTSPPPPGVGSAYLFDISDLANPTRIKLHADDGVAGDGFGISVGVSDTTVIVGAYDADNSPAISGAAYVFDISDPANPTQAAKLLSDDSGEFYTGLVAISGTTALVGAFSATGRLVYLFDISDPANPMKFELRPDDGNAGDFFGISAAISGTKAIVGAYTDDDNGPNSGSAYLFDISDPANPTRIKLRADDGNAGDLFGTSVAISGTTAIVGAPAALGTGAGSAYLVDISDFANPTQIKLRADDGNAGDFFGISVAISGTTAIVGSFVPGAAYLFDISDPENPTQTAKLLSDAGEVGDGFGISVGISGSIVLVGAPGDDDNGENSGSAYIFGVDTDGDGLPDDWETNGIPYTDGGGAGQRFMLPGSDPFHKDLYIEVDAMEHESDPSKDRTPSQAALNQVVTAFSVAPQMLVQNPDGKDGISLHLEPSVEPIPYAESWSTVIDGDGECNFWIAEFDEAKARFFGTPEERAMSDWVGGRRSAKAKAYRYCIFANSYGPTTSTGLAELPGDDFMVTLSKERMVQTFFQSFVDERWDDMVSGTFMHELGHTLGLLHGGRQDSGCQLLRNRYNFKPNYHSVMNYTWQYPSPSYASSWVLDYSRVEWADLDESALDERVGIGGHLGHFVPYGPPPSSALAPEFGPVNWNLTGTDQQSGVAADINYLNSVYQDPSPGDLLWGQEDWSELQYKIPDPASGTAGARNRTTFGDEITVEILSDFIKIGRASLRDAADFQSCFRPSTVIAELHCSRFDYDRDGTVSLADFVEFHERWW